jgi:hypothetical protein
MNDNDILPNKIIRRLRWIRNKYYGEYHYYKCKKIVIIIYIYILYWFLCNAIHFDVIILGTSSKESRWNIILKEMGYKCLFISCYKKVDTALYYPPVGYFKRNELYWEWNLPTGKIRSKYLLIGKEYPVQYMLSHKDHVLHNKVKELINKVFENYLST